MASKSPDPKASPVKANGHIEASSNEPKSNNNNNKVKFESSNSKAKPVNDGPNPSLKAKSVNEGASGNKGKPSSSNRGRLPINLPRRNIDIYVTGKSNVPRLRDKCIRLLETEPLIYVHSCGSALATGLNLALSLQKTLGSDQINLETMTNTLDVGDDFEPTKGEVKHTSSVHIKLQRIKKESPELTKVPSNS